MVQKNSLVLYKQEPALVLDRDDKITIQYGPPKSEKPETQRVREKDIVLLAQDAPSLKAVRDFAEKFAKQTVETERRLTEAYELLADDPGIAVGAPEIAGIAFGEWNGETAWAYYTAIRESPFFALTASATVPAFAIRSRAEAADIRAKQAFQAENGEKRTAFMARLKKRTLDLPDDTHFMQEVEAVALGQSVKSRIMGDLSMPPDPQKAHRLLLDTGVWTRYRNPYPSRRGLSSRSASEGLAAPPDEPRLRLDHTALAIDNPWSADPDDAVFFDGMALWVHIADPACTVTPDSSIDLTARNRGATLYLPEGAARMLAEESLEDYALGLTSLSRALSFKITLNDAPFSVGECEVFKTLVKVRRLTYDEAESHRDDPDLAPLFDIARKNLARRKASGAIAINMPEVHIRVQNDSVSIDPVIHNDASTMVQEMMLLAGEAAAKFAFKRGLAFPYASQEAPEVPAEIPNGLAGDLAQIKCMRPKTVSTTPGSHSGLGLAMYSQVTSPLRRYSDLVAHQQLRSYLAAQTGGGAPPLNSTQVLERILQGDAAAAASVKAERDSNLHWTLVYLMERPGWTGEAVVVELRGYQAMVIIPSLARQTVITTAKKAALNDVLTVKAGHINLPDLAFTFIETEGRAD
ncbi:MAG: RNB domain-containing ribonuclease [Spirochaetaceae bacterium]|jgi:exoribonuclease-2|nr:RNB domain-containing ribonuclease [Spirochaetaceae bacterium]